MAWLAAGAVRASCVSGVRQQGWVWVPLSALTSVLDSRARREEGFARMAVVPFAPAAAAVVPEDAPGLVPAFEKLLADPPRVARSDDPRMALGKLHFYVLAKRLTPTAAIDVLSGAGGRPLARELAARAAIESVFGPLVDSPKSGCYWWCRGAGKVVVGWQFTELGEAEYREETAGYALSRFSTFWTSPSPSPSLHVQSCPFSP